MKWLKYAIIVSLIIMVFMTWFYKPDHEWELNEAHRELKEWQDAYARLANVHDSLDEAYVSLEREFEKQDSLYLARLQINKKEYEKFVDGFGTLTVDEHIQLLSEFLSKKDSI